MIKMRYEDALRKWTSTRGLRELKLVEYEEIIDAYSEYIEELEKYMDARQDGVCQVCLGYKDWSGFEHMPNCPACHETGKVARNGEF